jgi:hypothetical protein
MTSLPASGTGITISLTASAANPRAGQPVTLTAVTSADVGPTPYFITICNETTGAVLAACGSGTGCSVTVTQDTPGAQGFAAYVGDVPAGTRPEFVLAASSQVEVSWWRLIWREHRSLALTA